MSKRQELVGLIYEAAGAPDTWTPALDGIVRLSGGMMGAMFFYDRVTDNPVEAVTVCGFSPACVADYGAHYGRLDPRLRWATDQLPAAGAYADDRELPFAQVAQSETYQDYYRPLGLGACLGGSLFKEPSRQGFLTVHRDIARGPFRPAEVRRFETLLPHVIRALQLHRQLAAAEQRSAGLACALDHMPQAVLMVDTDGALLHASRAGMALLAAPHAALRLRQGRLRPADSRAADRLLRALRQAADSASGHAPPPAVHTFPRPTGDGAVALMVVAAPDGQAGAGPRPLLVFAADSAARARTDAGLLATQFGLTLAEAAVASALASGDAPEAIAERRGSSPATVRTQMKTIFGKLGVHSQSQLASLVARSLAVLRRPEGVGEVSRTVSGRSSARRGR